MYTLFLDTHSDTVVVAIYKDGKVIGFNNVPANRQQSSLAMPTIDKTIKEIGITIKDINNIIVVNGPGSFTGVRIGVTIAKTLAFVLNIPIRIISCLEIYAISNKKGLGKLIAVKDPKGYYYSMFNQKDELMWDYNYLSVEAFDAFIEKKHLERMLLKDNFEYDIDIIFDYAMKKKPMKAHEVNPLYVKSIEVGNGSKS